jgi:hypothetical protein
MAGDTNDPRQVRTELTGVLEVVVRLSAWHSSLPDGLAKAAKHVPIATACVWSRGFLNEHQRQRGRPRPRVAPSGSAPNEGPARQTKQLSRAPGAAWCRES